MGYMFSGEQYKYVSGVNTLNVIMPEKKMPNVHGKRKLREKSSCRLSQKILIIVQTLSKVEQNTIRIYEPGVHNFEIKQEGFLLFSKAVSEPGWYSVPTNQGSV